LVGGGGAGGGGSYSTDEKRTITGGGGGAGGSILTVEVNDSYEFFENLKSPGSGIFLNVAGSVRGGKGSLVNNTNGENGFDGFDTLVSFLNLTQTFVAFGGKGGRGGIVGEIDSIYDYYTYGGAISNITPSTGLIIGGPGGVGRASLSYVINNLQSANLKLTDENLSSGYSMTYTMNGEIIPPNNTHWLPFKWLNLPFNGNYNRPSLIAPTGGGGGGGRLNTTILNKNVQVNLNGNNTTTRQLDHAWIPGRGGFQQNVMLPNSIGEQPSETALFNTIVGVGGNGGSFAYNKIFTPQNGKFYGGGGGGGAAGRAFIINGTVFYSQDGGNGARGSITIIEE
jgi:hypothetical protein